MNTRGPFKVRHRPRQATASWLSRPSRCLVSQKARDRQQPERCVAGNGSAALEVSDPRYDLMNPAWEPFARSYRIKTGFQNRVGNAKIIHPWGYSIAVSKHRYVHRYHESHLLPAQSLNSKFMSMYQGFTAYPLWSWIYDYSPSSTRATVRKATCRIAKRALYEAIRANGYDEHGTALDPSAFEDYEAVRGTELYGTIRVTIIDPMPIVKAKFEPAVRDGLLEDLTKQLRLKVIPQLQRQIEALPGPR